MTTTITTDPIADMLSRIRNAIAINSREINLPHSKLKQGVAQILVDNGFLKSVVADGSGIEKSLQIIIWSEGKSPRISEIDRLSTPGRRLYVGADEIPVIKRGRGLVVISTSRGMMSGQQARSERLGGELICKVY